METQNLLFRMLRRGEVPAAEGADDAASASVARSRLAALSDDGRGKAAPEAGAPGPGAGTPDGRLQTQKPAPGAVPDASTREATMSTPQTVPAEKKAPASAFDPTMPATMSILSPTLKLSGIVLETLEDLTVQGSIDGTIRVRDLVVARGATVSGTIVAEFAKVYGTLTGDITANALVVASGAALGGQVKGGKIGIQPGARIKASLEFGETEHVAAEEPETAAQSAAQPAQRAQRDELGFSNIIHLDRASA